MATPFCSTPIIRNKTAKRARVGSNTCPKCEILITDKPSHIACSVCELSYCMYCTNVSHRLAEALKEDTIVTISNGLATAANETFLA